MSRILAPAATALLCLALASPSEAGIFGRGKKPQAKPAPAATAAAVQPRGPAKATAAERALAARQAPLTRAAFWANQVQIDPADADAGIQLAAALRALGKPADAVQAVETVLATQPGNVDALLELARAHIARGEPFHAMKPARDAARLAPRDWRAPSLLGVAYEGVDRAAEARAAWEQALTLSPENPGVLANLALSWAAAGDLPKAEGLLRRAAARPDATLKVRQNLVFVLGMQGKMAEAERLLRDDLPPEMAAANLAWLRSATATGGRSWDAVRDAPGS